MQTIIVQATAMLVASIYWTGAAVIFLLVAVVDGVGEVQAALPVYRELFVGQLRASYSGKPEFFDKVIRAAGLEEVE